MVIWKFRNYEDIGGILTFIVMQYGSIVHNMIVNHGEHDSKPWEIMQ